MLRTRIWGGALLGFAQSLLPLVWHVADMQISIQWALCALEQRYIFRIPLGHRQWMSIKALLLGSGLAVCIDMQDVIQGALRALVQRALFNARYVPTRESRPWQEDAFPAPSQARGAIRPVLLGRRVGEGSSHEVSQHAGAKPSASRTSKPKGKSKLVICGPCWTPWCSPFAASA